MQVSIVVLTYNEEHRIHDCLASAAWCEEIIVVDGHSTDRTVEIARQFTNKVLTSDLLGPDKPGGFAAQRNFALDHASSDWIFFLDADERFTPELAREIPERLRAGVDEGIAAFRVRRNEHFFGVFSPYTHGESWLTRLVRKGKGRWDDKLVHEGLVVDSKTESLGGYIDHYSKDSIAAYLATQNRYTTLEAEQAAAKGEPMPRSPLAGMVKTFLNTYIYKGSYREGAFGLIMSLLFTYYHFLCWAKRWEIEVKGKRITGDQPRMHLMETMGDLLGKIWRLLSPPRG